MLRSLDSKKVTRGFFSTQCRDTNKIKTKHTMSLSYSSICNMGSRIGWVSLKEIYQVLGCIEQYIILRIGYKAVENKKNNI